jgi:hypothetical protein
VVARAMNDRDLADRLREASTNAALQLGRLDSSIGFRHSDR